MSLPTMSGVGRALDDPELRFSANGVAVCKLRLAFNSRKKDEATGQWSDDKSFFVDATAFKQMAENIAECVTRGTEVVVSGRLVTESWEDKNGGGKRSKPSLLIDSIGPSIQFNPATVRKLDRSGGQPGNAQGGGRSAQPARANAGGLGGDDPWASSGGGFGNDDPPFAP